MHVLSKNDVCVSEKIQVNFLKFDSFVGNQKFWEEFIEEPFLARVILHMWQTKSGDGRRERRGCYIGNREAGNA